LGPGRRAIGAFFSRKERPDFACPADAG